MSSIKEISPSAFASMETGTVYTFDDRVYSRSEPNTKKYGGKEVIKWGSDNLLPHFNRKILAENDIKQNLIETDVNIAAGQYLYLYTRKIEDGKEIIEPVDDNELEEWLEAFRVHEQLTETITDLKEMGNSWFEFILNRGRNKVVSGMSQDAVDCRLRKNPKGSTRKDADTLLLADWKNSKLKGEDIQSVPLLDIRNPQLGNELKVALHIKEIVSGFPYYNLVKWHGTKDWTEVANTVPKFHKKGLKDGYMLRYHIKIPMSYIEALVTDDKKAAEVKKDVMDEIESVLKGSENAHKAFTSFINDKLQMGGNNMFSEFKIEKIETDLKDDSYLKLHSHASMVHARGQGIDPALGGFEAEGRLSAGSEIKNKLNFHIAYKTPRIRRLALRPFNLIKDFNFPEKKNIKIGIGDMDFTTLDESPSGVQPIVNQN